MSQLATTAADAETSLLGAAMLGADVADLAALVEPGDFYHPLHGEIWAAICRVHNTGGKPDPVSVRVALDQSGVRNDPLELLRMLEMTPGTAAASYYAEQVASAAGHRSLVNAGMRVQQLASTPGDIEERREQARQIVDDACKGKHVSRARSLATVLPSVIDTAEQGQAKALSTPWADLDQLTTVLAPGRLVVVGARPGVGKSLLLTNLALHVAGRHEHAVMIASMEMPEVEVGQRLLSAYAGVDIGALASGQVDEISWGRIASKHDALAAMPITIDDAPNQTVTSIRRAARDIQRTREDLALIAVDYLQLMGTASKDNRAEALGEVSRGLKLLARETGACVVAAAQINRQSTNRSDGRPRQSDLRESGAIEADADQVILLHQPDDQIPEIEVIVDKNRHGAKGTRHLQVWGHHARLVGVERR